MAESAIRVCDQCRGQGAVTRITWNDWEEPVCPIHGIIEKWAIYETRMRRFGGRASVNGGNLEPGSMDQVILAGSSDEIKSARRPMALSAKQQAAHNERRKFRQRIINRQSRYRNSKRDDQKVKKGRPPQMRPDRTTFVDGLYNLGEHDRAYAEARWPKLAKVIR